MCDTGCADGCRERNAYCAETNRIANPGKTPVTLYACAAHLGEAVTEMLAANASLVKQGMPAPYGLRLGFRDRGVTVVTIAPDPGET